MEFIMKYIIFNDDQVGDIELPIEPKELLDMLENVTFSYKSTDGYHIRIKHTEDVYSYIDNLKDFI